MMEVLCCVIPLQLSNTYALSIIGLEYKNKPSSLLSYPRFLFIKLTFLFRV